ncbi:hypothetical protein NL676_034979 [Syzygium grande]|nr:hypothetical protein NL676_034979 [Syzygium grande]
MMRCFPVNEEDKDEHKIPEGGKNEPVESIALAISDKPSLPPKAEAKSSESDKSVTETLSDSSNVQSSPSFGGSSIMRGTVKINLSDVEQDKDSSLSVNMTGTKTTGVSPSTDMPLDRASTISSLATIVSASPPPAAQPKP